MSYRVLTAVLTLLTTSVGGASAIAREPLVLPLQGLIAQTSGTNQPSAQPQPSQGVQQLQSRLAQLGYYDGPVDGIFSAETRDALATFQRDRGLVGTGILDPITQAQLVNPGPNQGSPGANEGFVDPALETPSTPNAAPAQEGNANPLAPDSASSPLPSVPPDTAPEDLIESEGTGSSAPNSEGLTPEAGEEGLVEGQNPLDGEPELNPETAIPNDLAEAEVEGDRPLFRTILLGLAIMAFGGIGTGLVLWLAKRGSNSAASDAADNNWDETVAVKPASVSRSSPLYRGGPSTTRAAEPNAWAIEPRSRALEATSEPRVARINIVDELIQDLASPDPAIRHKAIWELGQRGNSAAVQPLTSLLVEADSNEQSLVLAALCEISMKTLKPMSRAVALALQDENPEVRKNAIRDLSRVYDSLGQVGRMLGHATADSDPEVRQTANWALEQLNHLRLSANESAALLPENRGAADHPLPEDGSSSR